MRMRVIGIALAVCGVLGGTAAAKSRQLVVSLERTVCMGDCPVYKVTIFDDGLVEWKGKANVAKQGAARGRADPVKLAALIDAFVKARFLEMDSSGTIPKPLPPGSMRTIELACTDTSHAITTFRQGPGKKLTRKLDDPHCKGANALTALEKLVDEVAGTRAFIEAAATPSSAKLDCKADSDCVLSCDQGAVNQGWYKDWSATHRECEDGCSSKGLSSRCVQQRCVAFRGNAREDGCTAKP